MFSESQRGSDSGGSRRARAYPLTQPDDVDTAGFSEADEGERYTGPEEEEEE